MDEHDGSAGSGRGDSPTTARLIRRAQHGDLGARDELFDRHRQELARWAHGRLPKATRDLRDTDDLVQDSMLRALGRLQHFEPQRNGSFLAYLCQILNNLVRDEMRSVKRRPGHEELTTDMAASDATPAQEHDAVRVMDRYRHALKKLSTDQRDALILRLELGLPYEAIAEELGRANVNAVRSLVSRGLERLTRLMETPAS